MISSLAPEEAAKLLERANNLDSKSKLSLKQLQQLLADDEEDKEKKKSNPDNQENQGSIYLNT